MTTAEAEEAVSELLAKVFGLAVASYRDAETGQTSISIYLDEQPSRPVTWHEQLRHGLKRIRQCGLNAGPARISLRRVGWEDWAESWKRHFRPISIGKDLIVKPSWSRVKPRKGQAVVVLDPGLSFGTGQHPTTAFCLEQLVIQRRRGEAQSLLDIGTGSGILAIAAAKLGYGPVRAFDSDPEAIRVACVNARRNRVRDSIRLSRQDLTRLPVHRERRYSVVCANLISSLLLAQGRQIVAVLAPNGVLLLAGILKEEFSAVQAAYEVLGLRLVACRTRQEWRSGAFSFAQEDRAQPFPQAA